MRIRVAMAVFGLIAPLSAAAQVPTSGRESDLPDPTQNIKGLVEQPYATTATKTWGLSIQEAPSVVRVFTRTDIERSGVRTLRDLLAFVPGVQVQEYRAGHQVAWIRGVQSRYNNKVLWLLDGVPLRDGYYGHHALDEMVPLSIVERVEIINGPGSVLYGTNAFSGVVSITTRRDGNGVFARYGTFDTAAGGLDLSGRHFHVSGSFYDTAGFHPDLNEDGKAWEHAEDRRRSLVMGQVFAGNFEATVGYDHYRYADTYRLSSRDRFHTRSPLFGEGTYHHGLGPTGTLNFRAYYEFYDYSKTETRFRSPGDVSRVQEDITNTSLYGADLDTSWLWGRHTALLGASHQTDQDEDFRSLILQPTPSSVRNLAVPRVRRHDLGVFAQDLWSVTPHLNLLAGLRYDVLSDFQDEVSYRAGITGNRGWYYGKLLFGTAFRVPSYREYLDRVAFNFSLTPERMRTYEAQAGRRFGRSDVNLTLYHNRYQHFIKELFVATIDSPEGTRVIGDEYAVNANFRRITGLELQALLYPAEPWMLNLSVSRILSAQEALGPIDPAITVTSPYVTGTTDVAFLARTTGTALVTYSPTARWSVGLGAMASSKRIVPAGYQSAVPAAAVRPQNADGFFKADLFVSARLVKGLVASLKVANVFDARIYSPPIDNPAAYDNQWPGRTVDFGLGYRF